METEKNKIPEPDQQERERVLQEVAAQEGQDCACDETIQVPEPDKKE